MCIFSLFTFNKLIQALEDDKERAIMNQQIHAQKTILKKRNHDYHKPYPLDMILIII